MTAGSLRHFLTKQFWRLPERNCPLGAPWRTTYFQGLVFLLVFVPPKETHSRPASNWCSTVIFTLTSLNRVVFPPWKYAQLSLDFTVGPFVHVFFRVFFFYKLLIVLSRVNTANRLLKVAVACAVLALFNQSLCIYVTHGSCNAGGVSTLKLS